MMLNTVESIKINNDITRRRLCKLSCDTIFKYDFISHHKMITKARQVIERNKKVVDSFSIFLSEFESKFRGII